MTDGDLFEVRLTEAAEADLEGIHDYIAEVRATDDAEALLDRILDQIDSLERFPFRGPVPGELSALGETDYRQLLNAPYRIIYRVTDKQVLIMLVADGRRDMRALLQSRLLGQ